MSNEDKPKDVSLTQVLNERPRAGWLKITGGHFDYSHVVVVKKNSKVDQIYVPYRGDSYSIAVIASIRDPAILEAVESNGVPSIDDVLVGTVERTGFFTGTDVDEFKNSGIRLDEPLVIIHRNADPEPLMTWLELLFGIVGTVFLLNIGIGLLRSSSPFQFANRNTKKG